MIIKKIKFKNFLGYGNKEQEINLTGTGLTEIQGENGVGKTATIIDSLLFAFYAKSRTGSINDVVNNVNEKDCKVTVEFSQNNIDYTVIRYRLHSVHKNNIYLFQGNKDISENTATETQAKIQDLIKISYVGFTNSTLFSSELYSEFLGKDISDRLTIFENLLNLKEFTILNVETKKVIKELNENLNNKKLEYSAKESSIKTIEDTITNYSNNAKSKLIKMKADKEAANKLIKEAKERISKYSSVDINSEKMKLSNNLLKEEYNNSLSKLNSEKRNLIIKEPVEDLSIFAKYRNINWEENRLKELKYKEDLETIKARESGYKLASSEINTYSEKVKNENSSISVNEHKIIELNRKIESLNKALCPFCGQHLTSAVAQNELDKSTKEIKELKDANEELKENLNNDTIYLNEQRENYDFLLKDYNMLKERLDTNFVPNSDFEESKFNTALVNIENYKKQKALNEEKENELEKEINELINKINNLVISPYTEEELNSISSNIEKENSLIKEQENIIIGIDNSVSSVYDKNYVNNLKKDIEHKNEELEDIKNELLNIDNDLRHYSYLGELFGNKSNGIKKHYIEKMLTLFNQKTNQYLPFFFKNKIEIIFDKNLNEKIIFKDKEVTFKSLSQGQRQRAELAVLFALFEVARVFFSNDNNLLILDEIIDKGLDKNGIKAVVNLLNGFDKQLKIFVVSHNALVDEEIPDKIRIEKDSNDFTVIV